MVVPDGGPVRATAGFKAAHPAIAIELETNHRGVDPDSRDFDAWFAYTGETAALHGIGAVVGRPMLIAQELERRTLVPVFDRQIEAPERCCLITTAAARQRPEVQAFREWVLREAEIAGRPAAALVGRQP